MLSLIQHAGQKAFLAAEGLFNRVFGDALNPFYYLGAIAYYLLWVVVASGLYLYVFFKTGVHEAYDSVEYLTHQQWWLGGVMRSFHRYASDAMVLAMALHLVRHFTFDQYRSFRWFSWISGVILLWLTFVAGVNGYMLPWDRTAQFVTVGTRRVARLAADVQRHAGPQFHFARRRQRPAVLAAVVPAHRLSARRSGAAVDPHPARAGRQDHAAAPDLGWRHAGASRVVAREAGAVRTRSRPRCGTDDDSSRLVLSARLSRCSTRGRRRRLDAGRRIDGAPVAPAVAAAQAHGEGRPASDGPARQPDHSGAPRRDDPRSRVARGNCVPVRMPQRRLRPVQMHGALRSRRARPAPGIGTLRRGACPGNGARLQRDAIVRHRDGIRAAGAARRHSPARIHGKGRRDEKRHRRRDDRQAQGERRADSILRRPIHQHHAAGRASSEASRSPRRRMSTATSNCRSD